MTMERLSLIVLGIASGLIATALAALHDEFYRALGIGTGALAIAQGSWAIGFAALLWGQHKVPALNAINLQIGALATALAAAGLAFADEGSAAFVAGAMALCGVGSAALIGASMARGLLRPVVIGLCLGVVLSGWPLAWAIEVSHWRDVLWGVSALSLCAGLLLLRARREPVPNHSSDWPSLSLLSLVAIAGFLGFRGSWAGPYLRDIFGLEPSEVGVLLSAMSLAFGTTVWLGAKSAKPLSPRTELGMAWVMGVLLAGLGSLTYSSIPLMMACLCAFCAPAGLLLGMQPHRQINIASIAITCLFFGAVQVGLGLVYNVAFTRTGLGTSFEYVFWLAALALVFGATAITFRVRNS
ncbi:MAG: hypothetical protein MK098_01850 [Marinovum sp.]|nr:hypothetical protein [Marinovum sp.]